MRKRRNSNVDLAAGLALVGLVSIVAVQFVAEALATYPREGVILLASIALGFIIAVARKLWK